MTGAGAFAPGLCSVTLRGSSVGEVVDVAAGGGLAAIEWGGDVHVPAGDLAAAASAGELTAAAGLVVGSYGSYLFAEPTLADDDIARVVETAAALGAPWVRVWCPFGVEPGAPEDEVVAVAATLRRITGRASAVGVGVYVEFHGQTLTATEASAAAVLAAASSPAGPWSAWQPPYWDRTRPLGAATDPVGDPATGGGRHDAADRDEAGIAVLAPRLVHVHVYAWDHEGGRHPLATQADAWVRRLRAAALAGPVGGPPLDDRPRLALLEFVPDDDRAAVATEAATLRSLLASTADDPDHEEVPT